MLLEENGFGDFNAKNLLKYIYESTAGREYGKFIFTRSVSNILELIAKFSNDIGLTRDEVSHIPIDELLKFTNSTNKISTLQKLRKISKIELEKHQTSIAIRLPQLLTNQAGVYIVPFQVGHPNFITNKKIQAQCIALSTDLNNMKLSEKIIIIEGADPGFDWIFSQNIAGLITKYGGVNSHMAIRCAEFGIPAAIGCGEVDFEILLKSNKVHLDCASGLIKPMY